MICGTSLQPHQTGSMFKSLGQSPLLCTGTVQLLTTSGLALAMAHGFMEEEVSVSSVDVCICRWIFAYSYTCISLYAFSLVSGPAVAILHGFMDTGVNVAYIYVYICCWTCACLYMRSFVYVQCSVPLGVFWCWLSCMDLRKQMF
jgi:hypothetical protein